MLRREFISLLGVSPLGLRTVVPPISGAKSQRVLVLGGTNFVGPAIVSAALKRGHEVTLFNRGVTRPHLFPGVEKLRGLRRRQASDLRALGNSRTWDTVIDVWPEDRALVQETVDLFRDRADRYAFVSSIAAFSDFSVPGLDESGLVRIGPPGSYGAEKAAAEEIVRDAFLGRYVVARCHAIIGPYDSGASYHYWLRKLATRDEVLCPGTGMDPVQAIDARDLAEWIVGSVEEGRSGTFNMTGPWPPRTMRDFLTATARGIGSAAGLTWVDADALREEHRIASFSNMPLWAPLDEDEGFYQIDGSAAIAAGADFRDPELTAADSWRWFQSHFFKDVAFPLQGTGISDEREDGILRAWHSRGRPDTT